MSVQDVTTVIAAVGGLGGAGAFVTTVLGRRKLKAEAADVITDTALTLVEPLQRRVKEISVEAEEARNQTEKARIEAAQLRVSIADAMAILRRWRSAILSPAVSREELRDMVREEEPVGHL